MVAVVIVGAGFAGLSAARELSRRGVSFVVLEASSRAGGRTETAEVAGLGTVDLGGQFLNRDMVRLLDLARACGRSVAERQAEGESLAVVSGRARPADAFDPFDLLLDRPPEAFRGKSLHDVIASAGLTLERERLALAALSELLSADPARIGAESLARQSRSYASEWPEDEWFLPEGLGALAAELAQGLSGPVVFGAPVEAVRCAPGGVTVVDAQGAERQARAVLLAMSPVAARGVRVDPGLPRSVTEALASYEPGAVVKLVLRYADRFWAEQGLSGTVLFDEAQGISALDASTPEQARLVVFVGGPAALEAARRPSEELRERVGALLATALGPQALRPLAVAERRWLADPWLAGGYVARITPEGRPDAAEVLRDAEGPVRFACSESATSFPGFVEGAVVAGEDAAERIAREMSG